MARLPRSCLRVVWAVGVVVGLGSRPAVALGYTGRESLRLRTTVGEAGTGQRIQHTPVKQRSIKQACSAAYRAENEALLDEGWPEVTALFDTSGCEGLAPCANEEALQMLYSGLRRDRGGKGLLSLLPCDLFQRLSGRTVWLIGGPHLHQLYRAARCFLRDFVQGGQDLAPSKEAAAQLAAVNMTDAACTRLKRGAKVCYLPLTWEGSDATRAVLPALGALGATGEDIAIINSEAGPINMLEVYAAQVRETAEYLRAHKSSLPRMAWFENPAQHFAVRRGEFPSPAWGINLFVPHGDCLPIQGLRLLPSGQLLGRDPAVVSGGWRNQVARPLMRQAGLPVLGTWNASVMLWQLHAPGTCDLYCWAPYQMWMWQLYQAARGPASAASQR